MHVLYLLYIDDQKNQYRLTTTNLQNKFWIDLFL